MKKMMMILALLFAMVGSSFGEWSQFYEVKNIRCYKGGAGHLELTQDVILSTNENVGKILAIANDDLEFSKRLLAASLSIINTDKRIQFNVVSAADPGGNRYVEGFVIQ